MAEKILQTLQKRSEFLSHLQDDIKKNDSIYEECTTLMASLKESVNDIRDLSKYPEKTALIPLCKNLYVPGKIVHTGEYLIKHPGYPESYLTLHTVDDTLDALDKRIEVQEKIIEKADYGKTQLRERMKILTGNFENVDEEICEETQDMPEEIRSAKGVAVKVGGFYEILEFEE